MRKVRLESRRKTTVCGTKRPIATYPIEERRCMEPASTESVLAVTRQWLKPVIRVLICCGISWQQFAGLAKSAYVEVATRQFGKRGRPTNVSRVAVLTGLTRRDVRKQRERVEAEPAPLVGYVTKGSLILS